MIKAGIVGATGYAGVELVRLLQSHPQVEIAGISSVSYEGKSISEVYPNLYEICDDTLESEDKLIGKCDVIFASLPHGLSEKLAKKCVAAGVKLIDLGADFRLDSEGEPTLIPHDRGGYLDAAPFDKGENVRRDICLTLEKLGIKPISSHHERGPGQNEICFKNNDALKACDDLLTFKTVVRTVAAMNGLHASFMPKPLKDEIGSGLHINLSLLKDGENLFAPAMLSTKREAESFIAGILARAKEMAVFLNPTINSYERLEDNEAIEAYNKIAWSYSNGPQLVRIEQDGFAKMQLRSADPSCNPYIAYALLLFAGAEGIEKKMKLGKEADIENLEETDTLPEDLKKAIDIARLSDFIARYVPKSTLDKFIEYKENEYKNYSLSKDKNEFVTKLYFNKI